MESQIIRVRTGGRETVRDITSECAEFAKSASGGGDGILHVFVPHATAGVALLELPAFIAPYATVPVLGGRLALGTWQSIALVDVNVDNPDRQVRLSFLG